MFTVTIVVLHLLLLYKHFGMEHLKYRLSVYLKYNLSFFSCIAGCMSIPIEIKFKKHEQR